jgi:elongation factor Ts
MEVTAGMIKELKEKTGAGIVDCKQILQETGGDMNKSIEILRKKGLSKADKKSGREANEGLVSYKLEGKKGFLVKVNCETDFVAKTDAFKNFVEEVKEAIFKKSYAFSKTLPEEIEMMRKDVIAKLGENILVSEWKFIDGKGELFPYMHLNKVAVVADFQGEVNREEEKQMMKNLSMQITAMNPVAVEASSVPAEKVEELKKTFTEEAKATGKPEKVIENIIKGKFEKFYNESVLMEQLFILDEEKKVKAVLEEFNKGKEKPLKISSFVRVSL